MGKKEGDDGRRERGKKKEERKGRSSGSATKTTKHQFPMPTSSVCLSSFTQNLALSKLDWSVRSKHRKQTSNIHTSLVPRLLPSISVGYLYIMQLKTNWEEPEKRLIHTAAKEGRRDEGLFSQLLQKLHFTSFHGAEVALFPGLPFFCSSVCVQYNTRKRKSAKNGEGLGTLVM